MLVRYVGSRACKTNGVLWTKYEIKDVNEDFYEKFKNQGFELVEDKVVKKPIKKEKIIEEKIEEEEVVDVGTEDNDFEERDDSE